MCAYIYQQHVTDHIYAGKRMSLLHIILTFTHVNRIYYLQMTDAIACETKLHCFSLFPVLLLSYIPTSSKEEKTLKIYI